MTHTPRTTTIVLAGVGLALLWAYGREQRRLGESTARESALRAQVAATARRATSAESAYRLAAVRAERVEVRARALLVNRDRAVASTDSVLARADTLVASDPTIHRDSAFALLQPLRAALLSERSASDSAISSLSSALALKNAALVSCDSTVVALHRWIAVQDSLIRTLQRQAHPTLFSRSMTFAGHAAIGAGVALVLVLRR